MMLICSSGCGLSRDKNGNKTLWDVVLFLLFFVCLFCFLFVYQNEISGPGLEKSSVSEIELHLREKVFRDYHKSSYN